MKALLLTGLTLLVISTSCYAQSRTQALKPHINRIWNHWSNLPAEYKKQHRVTLENYLALFTKSNGYTWNREWSQFSSSMGSIFQPLYSDVIEAMKVAEAFEACFPNPEQKIENIAETIFKYTPANAVLFIHNDVLETILLIRQQAGVRPDVLIINSSRIMDRSYMQIILDRYAEELAFEETELLKNVFNIASQRKAVGDAEFQGLKGKGERFSAEGPQLLNALSFLMMQEIGKKIPNRPVMFLPSCSSYEPICAWRNLGNTGIFFTWKKTSISSENIMIEWENLLDAAAPSGSPVHEEMANAIGQSIYTAADILNTQGQKDVSEKLLEVWGQRVKSIAMVLGRDIKISKEKKMVQQIK